MSKRGKLFGWTRILRKRLAIFIALMAALFAATNTNATSYTVQQALNQIAGNSTAPYTRYTAQQAANLLLQGIPANAQINTTPKATLVIVVDDQDKQWFNGTVGANGHSIRTIMKTNHLVAGFSIGAYYVEARGVSDTTTNSLSVTNLQNLVAHDGDEVGSGGYFEGTQGGMLGGWWHGNSGHFAKGDYTQAQLDAAMDLHFSGNV